MVLGVCTSESLTLNSEKRFDEPWLQATITFPYTDEELTDAEVNMILAAELQNLAQTLRYKKYKNPEFWVSTEKQVPDLSKSTVVDDYRPCHEIVKEYLEHNPGWIIHIKDLPKYSVENLENVLPKSGGLILITSTNTFEAVPQTNIVEFSGMKNREARKLLEQSTCRLTDHDMAELISEFSVSYNEVCPLGLAHAVAFLETTGITAEEYIPKIRTVSVPREVRVQAKVRKTWELILQHFTEPAPWYSFSENISSEEHIFRLLSVFAPAPVPQETLQIAFRELSRDNKQFTKTYNRLIDASFLKAVPNVDGNHLVYVHPIHHGALVDLFPKEKLLAKYTSRPYSQDYLGSVSWSLSFSNPPEELLLLTHLWHVEHFLETNNLSSIYMTEANDREMNLFGCPSAIIGVPSLTNNFSEAILRRRAHRYEIKKKRSSTQELLANLGGVYYALGELQKAQEALESALALKEPSLRFGYEIEAFSRLLNTLGSVYRDLGQLEKSRDVLERARSVEKLDKRYRRRRSVKILVNLAATYYVMGEKQKSQEVTDGAMWKLRNVEKFNHEPVALLFALVTQLAHESGNKATEIKNSWKVTSLLSRDGPTGSSGVENAQKVLRSCKLFQATPTNE